MSRLILSLFLFTTLCLASQVKYENYTVLRLNLDRHNTHHTHAIQKLTSNKAGFQVNEWSYRDYMVSPHDLHKFQSWLQQHHITYTTYISNVQDLIEREKTHHNFVRLSEKISGPMDFFADYRNLDDIHTFIDGLITSYPALISKTNIGTSYEGRPLFAYTITGNGTTPGGQKPGIYFEGGIHAREWITHATQCYIINQLVTQYGVDTHITQVMDAVEWTIVPVVNVDGYVYTWTTDRNWRKTRTPNANSLCVGVDPNRNWDSHWCEQGADSDPCSDSYCGPKAFSEKCVKAVADHILTKPNIQAFIDFHSYSQLWMSPYGYTDTKPLDYQTQTDIGQKAVAAMASSGGASYQEGTIYEIIYPASGSSADWGYDTAKIKYSYGVEQRDQGQYGFVLPANQIIPSGQEILVAALVIADKLISNSTRIQ